MVAAAQINGTTCKDVINDHSMWNMALVCALSTSCYHDGVIDSVKLALAVAGLAAVFLVPKGLYLSEWCFVRLLLHTISVPSQMAPSAQVSGIVCRHKSVFRHATQ